MSYIKYIISSEERSSQTSAYQRYMQTKIETLMNDYQAKLQEYKKDSAAFEVIINNNIFKLDSNKIATSAMSKLAQAEVDANVSITSLYQEFNHATQVLQQGGDQVFKQSLIGDLIALRNGLIPAGKYTLVKGKNTLEQLQNPSYVNSLLQANIYNRLGDLGEATSSLAGSALIATVLEEVETVFGKIAGVEIQQKNIGSKMINQYHSQTDNNFTVSFILQESGAQCSIELNLSDKASTKLYKRMARSTSTSALYLRRSTVNVLSNDLDPSVYYNLISYHKILPKHTLLTNKQTWGSAYDVLSAYYGYKLLLDMFLTSKQYEQIHFTVFGDKIIPEINVLEQLLSTGKKSQKAKYTAQIESWGKLVSSQGKVIPSNEADAESIIDKMVVAIKTSLKF